MDWTVITDPATDTNKAFAAFFAKIEKLLDETAPIRKLTKKELGLKGKPWITGGLLTSMADRDKLYKEYTKEKKPITKSDIHARYKTKRNMILSLTRTSKKLHYHAFFQEHNSNIQKTWDGIRDLINVSKKSPLSIGKIIHGKDTFTDNNGISNSLNDFFVSIGSTVDAKIPTTDISFRSYLGDKTQNSAFLHPCSKIEVAAIISNFGNSKSSGPFSIPTRILKDFSMYLTEPLSVLINKLLIEGKFPDLLKSATVCPIFKKNDKTKCANYRPISLLSNIGKVYEKIMYTRIESFLESNDIMYNLQYGFRKKHSTNHALLSIIESIRSNLDNKTYSCGVFVDLEKAFDTVNHKILIAKLDHIGIRGVANQWIESYLKNRNQTVKLNGFTSQSKNISCGVPQGSILGPLLFLIYINDMNKAFDKCSVYHFADDTNLLFSHKNPLVIQKTMNKELTYLFQWLCANRLSLNVAKTEFILFQPPRMTPENRIILKLNGTKIHASFKIKYLGIILDHRLTWKPHLTELSKKLSRSVGMLFKIRDLCPTTVLRSLYFSIFNSHLSYGLPIWGNANCFYVDKIFKIQKMAIRAISFADFNAHSAPLFKKLEILTLKDLYQKQLASLLWDLDHNELPISLSKLFQKRDEAHSHSTRLAVSNKYTVKKTNSTRYGVKSFQVEGAILLNNLKDRDINNNSNTKTTFLMKFKKSILETY